ncbi:hypothetical protein GCM10023231_32370 [Olivibacter ginsenosidimutans]|uniref:Signal peptidase n=1 Tax=Olivibacter ginsenosidimutans TaxID=1176537 RepID=A0ABP9BW07_9SPHI
MKKLLMVLMAVIYSNFVLAGHMGDSEEYSTPKAVTYIAIAVILITVIATVLYKRPKRKFNE